MKPTNQKPNHQKSNKVAAFSVSFLDLSPSLELVRNTSNHRLELAMVGERYFSTVVEKEDLDQYYVLEENLAIMDLRIKFLGMVNRDDL